MNTRLGAGSLTPVTALPPPTLLFPSLIGVYLFFIGPGQAWWKGNNSATPRLLARIALSTLWTGVAALALAALEAFSIPTLALINAGVTLCGYLLVGRGRDEGLRRVVGPGFGLVVFALALTAYWPPYETHMFASDSSAYTAAGIHLVKDKRLGKHDPLLGDLRRIERRHMFPSVVSLSWRGPYARMPGGMVIETIDDQIVRPSFFPLPTTWAAVSTGLGGWRYAGAFAPAFAALALWAFWYLLRNRLSFPAAVLGVAIAALNAAAYWSGRFPLSEPLAWFYMMSGLVALDAYEDDGLSSDALLAGAALGGVALCRIEYGVFLVSALALRRLGEATLGTRRLPVSFFAAFLVLGTVAVAQAGLMPGAYIAPLADRLAGLRFLVAHAWERSPVVTGAAFAALAVIAAWIGRGRGPAAVLRLAIGAGVAGFVVFYCLFASHYELPRSVHWLSAYLGWPLLLLAAAGAVTAWKRRFLRPQDGFLVVLAGLIGGLLAYDPHVMQVMPWASRRFVPIVVPALVLFSVLGVQRISQRSLVAGIVAAAVLLVTALSPARAMWGQPYYAGNFASLMEFNGRLPGDGVLLIDKELSSTVLPTPLWLLFGRNSLPVQLAPPSHTKFVAGLTHQMAPKGPVYLLTRTEEVGAPYRDIQFVRQTKILDYTFQTLLPEQTMASPPRLLEPYTTRVSVLKLEPVRFPSRKPAPPQQRPGVVSD